MLETLQKHHERADSEGFKQALTDFLPQLKRYVANRLRTAVRKGWVPKGEVSALDIVDEVYLTVFEQFDASRLDERKLRTLLFTLADEKLDEVIEEFRRHRGDLSIEQLADQELRTLEEHITADADGEVVFVEDLDDISYHLDDERPKVWLLDEGFEQELVEVLDLPREVVASRAGREVLAATYQNLPTLSRIVLDLRTRGGLSVTEIAEVRGLTPAQVEKLLAAVRNRFLRALEAC